MSEKSGLKFFIEKKCMQYAKESVLLVFLSRRYLEMLRRRGSKSLKRKLMDEFFMSTIDYKKLERNLKSCCLQND